MGQNNDTGCVIVTLIALIAAVAAYHVEDELKPTIIAAALLLTAPVMAQETAAEFFARDKVRNWTKPLHESVYGTIPTRISENQKFTHRIIVREVKKKLGQKWVQTAVRLAKIESSFRCNAVGPRTRHGRALGVFQVMPGSARALGYDPRRIRECEYGIAAGIAHMQACINSGVTTHTQMAACHVAGVKGWKIRLSRKHESYKQHYIRLAMRREE